MINGQIYQSIHQNCLDTRSLSLEWTQCLFLVISSGKKQQQGKNFPGRSYEPIPSSDSLLLGFSILATYNAVVT